MGADKSILDKLSTRKLAYPDGIECFIIQSLNKRLVKEAFKRSYFVDTLYVFEGRLVQRIFAFKFNYVKERKNPHKTDMYIQEVYRRVEGEKKALMGDVCASYCGKEVYYNSDPLKLYPVDDTYHFYPFHFYDENEWIKKLDIPYCQYFNEKNKSGLDFFRYVCLYRKYPKIEYLVKMDLSHFIKHITYLDTSKRFIKDIFKIEYKFVEMLPYLNFQQLMYVRRYPWINSQKEIGIIDDLYYFHFNYIKKYLNQKMMNYITEHSIQMGLYDDYLGFCEKLKADMKSNILYPKDLKKAHDEAAEQITIIKSKATEVGFRLNYEEHKKLIYQDDGYIIRPVMYPDELVNESEKLNHCVKTYTDIVAKCETEILFVRDDKKQDEPLYTLELRGNKIIQFRADHNKSPDESAIQFVNKWAKMNKLESPY